METSKGYSITYHENGLIAVDQGLIHGKPVSFNPDDDKFYVHGPEDETLARFKDFRNAVQYAKTH